MKFLTRFFIFLIVIKGTKENQKFNSLFIINNPLES